MNIVAILANGVGNRFESNIPKQFHRICEKMVIEYVIEAAFNSGCSDSIIIASDLSENGAYLIELKSKYDVDIINGGKTRNITLKSVIDYIGSNYNCNKLVVCDAVRPLITGNLINSYFSLLDEYDAVVTAQKITDSLGCYNARQIDRDDYYLMQSPEGFNFKLLQSSFDADSNLTEVTHQLPSDSRIKLYFEFGNNFKLTYPEDLKYLELMIKERSIKVDFHEVLNSVCRLKAYLNKEYSNQLDSWISNLQNQLPVLLKKWKIEYFDVLKSSHFGIVLFADSLIFGKCVIKIIPPFIDRYEQEKNCYKDIDSSIMCNLIDYDDSANALLLERCNTSENAEFNNRNDLLINLFARTKKYFCSQKDENRSDSFKDYYELLCQKAINNDFDYKTKEVMAYVKKAIEKFEEVFKNSNTKLIHGDLHRYNIVEKDNRLLAIDPIGYIAPFEFELARYICTELTDSDNCSKEQFTNIVNSFCDLSEKDKIINACYIDMIFRLHNSIFENDDYSLTDKWIETLKILFDN